jgi:hypothetical protein
MDDPGGGLPLPVLLGKDEVFGQRDGHVTYNPADVLFTTTAAKSKFTKEINLAHAAYVSSGGGLLDIVGVSGGTHKSLCFSLGDASAS